MSAEECALRITERIWLRAFGTLPNPALRLDFRNARAVFCHEEQEILR